MRGEWLGIAGYVGCWCTQQNTCASISHTHALHGMCTPCLLPSSAVCALLKKWWRELIGHKIIIGHTSIVHISEDFWDSWWDCIIQEKTPSLKCGNTDLTKWRFGSRIRHGSRWRRWLNWRWRGCEKWQNVHEIMVDYQSIRLIATDHTTKTMYTQINMKEHSRS